MPRDRVEIDYERKAVAIGVGDSNDPVPIMRAAYREGIGCVVMGIKQTFADIDKLPKMEMAPLPGDPAAIPWPNGDLVEKKPLPDKVNQAALKAAGEWTFDRGARGQFAVIVPSYDLVVVRRGLDWRAGHKSLDQWDMLAEVLKAFPPPSQPPKKLPATP